MKVTCPNCQEEIPPENVNVHGVAHCASCSNAFSSAKLFRGRKAHKEAARIPKPSGSRIVFVRERNDRMGVVLPRGGLGAGTRANEGTVMSTP